MQNGAGILKSKRNSTLDILRLIFAVLIVALHSSPLLEINSMVSYLVSQTYSRLGVPFFATVSGYYLLKDFSADKGVRYLKKLASVFVFWSLLMFGYDMLRYSYNINSLISHIAKVFIFEGWHHLWYILAMIYTIVLLLLLWKIHIKGVVLYCFSICLLIIGVLMCAYGRMFLNLPIVCNTLGKATTNMETSWLFLIVPFFSLGYLLNKQIPEWVRKNCKLLLAICGVGYLVEIIIVTMLDLKSNVTVCAFSYPTIYILMVFALEHSLEGKNTLAQCCASVSSFTYYAHYALLIILPSVVKKFWGITMTETGVFVLTLAIVIPIGALLHKVNNPIIKRVL